MDSSVRSQKHMAHGRAERVAKMRDDLARTENLVAAYASHALRGEFERSGDIPDDLDCFEVGAKFFGLVATKKRIDGLRKRTARKRRG